MARRKNPVVRVLRALFARSGNQCAFPACHAPLVNAKNQFVGQVCHIEAASPGGARYNTRQTDEQRRDYQNLILLCYAHHIETNEETEYPVGVLKDFKHKHESKCGVSSYDVDENVLREIAEETEAFWRMIDEKNRSEHVAPPDVAVEVDSNATFSDLAASCVETLEGLRRCQAELLKTHEELEQDFVALLRKKGVSPKIFDDVPYYERPFNSTRNFEIWQMCLPNCLQRLEVDLVHMEIKFLEECLKNDGDCAEARKRLAPLRKRFAKMAQNEVLVD